jgi:hypothetical protein
MSTTTDSTTTEIIWEEPSGPRGIGRPRVWEDRLAPLRAHPRKWANLGRHPSRVVVRINGGHIAGVAAGAFEAKGRDHSQDRLCTLYVRYVGE